jgi:hypothetical protein
LQCQQVETRSPPIHFGVLAILPPKSMHTLARIPHSFIHLHMDGLKLPAQQPINEVTLSIVKTLTVQKELL